MKLSDRLQQITPDIICWLFIVLWCYAATAKILDFENFRIQIGQSPMVSAFAGWAAWLVPVTELLIAFTLVYTPYRLFGLFASYFLMVMFSAYIYIALHYSSFVPCSCGGILEKMGWEEHLAFNLAFVVIGAVAILLDQRIPKLKRHGYENKV
jgi:uncharacterized membrane protein YphA (DoxX/SURF4 family)